MSLRQRDPLRSDGEFGDGLTTGCGHGADVKGLSTFSTKWRTAVASVRQCQPAGSNCGISPTAQMRHSPRLQLKGLIKTFDACKLDR